MIKKITLGLAPGSLIYEGFSQDMMFRILQIDDANIIETRCNTIKELQEAIQKTSLVTWVQCIGIGDIMKLKELGDAFDINVLTLEDILNPNQRPKTDIHEEYTFISLRAYTKTKEGINNKQVSIIVKENILLSFQDTTDSIFSGLEKRFITKNKETKSSRIITYRYPYLTYAIIDFLIDQHFRIQEYFEERIEHLSQMIYHEANDNLRSQIHSLRMELLSFRKSVLPLVNLVDTLHSNQEYPMGKKKSIDIYLNDLKDHVIHLQDLVRTYTETLESLTSLYFSIVAEKTNQTMQVLTAITLTFLPLTFLAGLYGMNFKYMPELDKPWAYPLLLIVMLCIAISILWFFRKKKWL